MNILTWHITHQRYEAALADGTTLVVANAQFDEQMREFARLGIEVPASLLEVEMWQRLTRNTPDVWIEPCPPAMPIGDA